MCVAPSPRRLEDPLMRQLWKTHAPLTAASLVLVAALAVFAVGLAVDPRTIAGAPAWLKPAKFAVSIAIYGLTLVWIFRFIPDWPRTRRSVGWITAVVGLLETALVALQAWRGTTSHFNAATLFDYSVFATMGAAILVQWIASLVLAAALWRQRFDDAALGASLRAGVILAVLGAATGGLMTTPTPEQRAAAQATGRLTVSGAHTVGAPDGGPGLPGTKWSTEHGDLRVPHFLGLHALQALPLVAILLGRMRRIGDGYRLRVVRVAGGSYAALIVILLWQALRGQSVVAPDGTTLVALAAWASATLVALGPRPLGREPIAARATAAIALGGR
jgi:hypothetical protein